MPETTCPATRPHGKPRLAALALALVACGSALAADLEVRVSGLSAPLGRVGCSLFAEAKGFPMDTSGARVQWHDADAKGITCRFTGLPEGSYALAVVHDRNGNQRVDTNFVGLPTEPWGVSKNLRPTLRAPSFEEASFRLGGDTPALVLDVRVAQ
jgi:uncharacterized protein (DUF2141 family)